MYLRYRKRAACRNSSGRAAPVVVLWIDSNFQIHVRSSSESSMNSCTARLDLMRPIMMKPNGCSFTFCFFLPALCAFHKLFHGDDFAIDRSCSARMSRVHRTPCKRAKSSSHLQKLVFDFIKPVMTQPSNTFEMSFSVYSPEPEGVAQPCCSSRLRVHVCGFTYASAESPTPARPARSFARISFTTHL